MITDKKHVLILNLGLRSIRAIVFDNKGKKISHNWLPVRTYIEGDKVEQDPNEWWSLALRVIDKALTDDIRDKIGYVSVTSSSCNLIFVDSAGKSIGNCIMVSDKRSKSQAELLAKNSKLQPLLKQHNLLAVPSFIIPKILWVKENEPERFSKSTKFLSSDSYLLMKLSGEIITDPHNAEKAYYDRVTNQYPKEVLDLVGLDEDHFAPVKEVGTIVGTLLPSIVKEIGLSKDVKVIQTTYDALAAFWGAGITEHGEASIVCGTCSSIRANSQQRPTEKNKGILSQHFADQGTHVIGGSNNLEGGLLEWAKNAFYYDSYSKDDDYLFELMEKEAQESELGSKGLIFLPYLIGERAPFFDTEVRGLFFGLDRSHTRRDIMRAIFESIGFLSLDMIKGLEKSNVPISELRLSGGLGKNELISQIKADITGKKILLLDEAETTALGCFILIARALNPDIPNEDIRNLVTIKNEYLPDPERHKKYQDIFKLFKSIYATNKDNFKQRNQLAQRLSGQKVREINNL